MVLKRKYSRLPRYFIVKPLGINWVPTFLKQQKELRTYYMRLIK